MDEYTKEAIELVKIKASQVPMEHDAITTMVKNIAQGLREADGQGIQAEQPAATPAIEPAKAIREAGITCLECGKTFKILTKKHLATHGLTPEQYREKYGYRKGAPLAAKSLTRERRKRMKGMRLWERRGKTETQAQ